MSEKIVMNPERVLAAWDRESAAYEAKVAALESRIRQLEAVVEAARRLGFQHVTLAALDKADGGEK